MLQDLTWDNYLELTQYIDKNDFKQEYLSPIALVALINYEVRHKFHILPTKEILLYVAYDTSISDVKDIWSVSTCIYFDNSNIQTMKEQIQIDLKELNPSKDYMSFNGLSEHMLDDFDLRKFDIITYDYINNYIYEIDKMRTFAGKKLQKKRNHLNAFYSMQHNVNVKDLRDVNFQEISDYLDYHMNKYADVYRQYEIDIYHEFLYYELPKDKNFFGTVIYIDNKIVAMTLCYERINTCEVIIEKAERDVRGLYQFLIKTNLEIHGVKAPYMDRQDDGGIMELKQSKKSYYPIIMINRYGIENIKKW